MRVEGRALKGGQAATASASAVQSRRRAAGLGEAAAGQLGGGGRCRRQSAIQGAARGRPVSVLRKQGVGASRKVWKEEAASRGGAPLPGTAIASALCA